jgi:hypothetical protein
MLRFIDLHSNNHIEVGMSFDWASGTSSKPTGYHFCTIIRITKDAYECVYNNDDTGRMMRTKESLIYHHLVLSKKSYKHYEFKKQLELL